jgi:heme exporter protein B
MISVFYSIFKRDFQLATTKISDFFVAPLFLITILLLLPLGVGTDKILLSSIAIGLCWIAILLSCLLSINHIFEDDFKTGILEIMVLSSVPLPMLVFLKTLTFWFIYVLPLIIISPILSLFLYVPLDKLPIFLISILLGTPSIALLSVFGASLQLGQNKNGLLITMVILPLLIPVLIFGTMANQTLTSFASFNFLAAFFILFLMIIPFASGYAIKMSLENR